VEEKRLFRPLFFVKTLHAFTTHPTLSQKFKRHKLFMLTQSLVYFDNAENDEEPNLQNDNIRWKKVKEKIIAEVKLFYG